jgi:hypothetical protein
MLPIEGYRWPWKRVGPALLSAIVRELCGGDRELLSYADHLDYEAECHSRALDAVRTGDPVTLGRTPQLLEHWAYFSEIIRHRDDAARWDRKTLIAGHF